VRHPRRALLGPGALTEAPDIELSLDEIAFTLGVIVLRDHAEWPLVFGGALVLSAAALADQPVSQTAPQGS
jgi:hypothetical protein